jgi:hypothetical protein
MEFSSKILVSCLKKIKVFISSESHKARSTIKWGTPIAPAIEMLNEMARDQGRP